MAILGWLQVWMNSRTGDLGFFEHPRMIPKSRLAEALEGFRSRVTLVDHLKSKRATKPLLIR
jgi:hypothetical protein